MRYTACSLALTLTAVACGGGSTDFSSDLSAYWDLGSSPDVQLLPDAVILESGAPDFSPAPGTDAAQGDAAEGGFTNVGWNLKLMEMRNEYTAITDPTPDDTFGCGPDDEICAPGQACVLDVKTGEYGCLFVAECSQDGAVAIEDILTSLLIDKHFYIKLEAKVWLGLEACTVQVCPADDPCCNECFAPMYVGTEFLPVVLLGNGLAIGCQGSACDFDQMCKPLVPGKWYWIWGMVDLLGGESQLTVDGFCIVF